jgi:hypothetical protein
VTLAAFDAMEPDPAEPLVVVATGGNIDPARLVQLLSD